MPGDGIDEIPKRTTVETTTNKTKKRKKPDKRGRRGEVSRHLHTTTNIEMPKHDSLDLFKLAQSNPVKAQSPNGRALKTGFTSKN